MAEDHKNCSRLVQLITCNHLTEEIIDDILKDGSVDYQIPVNSILDSTNKELEGCTALHIVIRDGNVKAAKKLFQNGADFTIQNSIGETILHQMIQPFPTFFLKVSSFRLIPSDFDFINAILDAHIRLNIFKNPSDNYQLSHFHIACIVDHVAAVKFFIEKNASLDKPISFESSYVPGYTPLHLAADNSNFRTFKILLDQGADVTLKNAFGLSPLHLLIQNNKEHAISMEVNQGKLCNYEKIAFNRNREIIKLILINYQNKKIDILDDTGLSYFHVLCTLQNTSVIENYMSNNNFDMHHSVKSDSVFSPGYTALHFAAMFSPATVKVLLKHGASVLAKDAKGLTPLDLCLKKCKIEDIHSIIESQQEWKYFLLSDGKTSLLELIDAMKSENSLEDFIHRADVNAFIPMDSPLLPGYSSLHLVINLFKTGESTLYQERIRILLNAGVNVTAKNFSGVTPIHFAFSFHMSDIVNLLLDTNQLILDSVNEDINLSHLYIACDAGNVNVVRNILERDATSVNLGLKRNLKFDWLDLPLYYPVFVAGSTPLHIAVIKKNVELAGLLVEHGADVHVKDEKEMTPIHYLLYYEHGGPHVAPLARILFSVDNLKDVVTSFGYSHLHVACWASHDVAIEKLLDQGADVNLCLSNMSKLLTWRDKFEKQLQFLDEYRNYNPLNFALCRKQSNVMELLFRRTKHFVGDPSNVLKAARYTRECSTYEGFKKTHSTMLDAWEQKYGIKSIHVACYQFDFKAVEKLLEQGANPNAKVSSTSVYWSGRTPLHILNYPSVDEKKIRVMAKILIDHGADVTLTDANGNTLIHTVISTWGFKSKDTLLLLLKGQKNFNVNPGADSHRISHFHAACILNKTSVVEKFLNHGVDVNLLVSPMISFYGGYTPLQVAAFCDAKETLELLLKRGADIHVRDGVGNTALHCATIYDKKINGDRGISEPIVMSLIDAGAEVNATNKYGETPLELLLKTQIPTNRLLKILLKGQCCVNIFNNTNGIGFIATAIKRLTKIQNIFEHPVYQAVISSPKINEVDKDGRTPIHNIVSIPKVAASVQIYRKAIKGFMNVGIDIDQKNKMGHTALHDAVNFVNSKAVAALLALGANIIVVLNVETLFIKDWIDYRRPIDKLLQNERQIIKSFAKEVYKLQLLNINVDKMDKEIESELQAPQWNLDLKTVGQCQVELERMEMRKVGLSDIPWRSFLSETGVIAAFPTIRHVQRQMIHDVFEKSTSRLHREFPEFAGILHLQYRKALDRMELFEPAKAALRSLLNFNLPDLCYGRILRFLENAELIYLIDAEENPVSHVQKRRKIIETDAI